MEQITPSIAQIEELLSEFEIQYAEKSNMPLDWVSQYKTFQSHNITIENWNILNTYIHNVLSDTKSSYEFIISSMNLLFDTLKTLEDNDIDFSNRLTEIQSYLDLHKDLFNKGIIYIPGIVEGNAALSDLKEDQIILSIKYRTSIYVGGTELSAFQLFKVSNGKYVGIYTAEIEYIDLIIKHDKTLSDHAKKLTEIDTTLKNLHLERFVQRTELSDVAFSGEYSDLKGKPIIPTKVSDLVNDSGFITNAVNDLINYYTKSETLTKDEIIARIGAIKTIKFEIYASLDDITNPQTNVIYLIGTASPYTEYAYIEEIGFEGIGSTAIDLSNYVQSDDTLNTNNIIVGNGDKKVKDSGYSVANSVDNNANKIPTNAAVLNEINKYHEVVEISGESGDIPLGELDTPYRLIKDENGIYYRLVSIFEDDNLPAYFYQSMPVNITDDHLTNYILWIWKFSTKYSFSKNKLELVLHSEFDELVASTPTDVIYDKNTKVVQLTHDGMPIGEGAVVDINGFTPYYDGKTLVLSDVEELNADVATKEYVDEQLIKYIVIDNVPTTATSGTITNEQLSVLLENRSNYIQFFNENFYPQDVETSEGYIVYSHVGSIGGETKIKTINLTIATGGWVLTETPVSSRAITITNTLPEANEENYLKGKIYTQGELLQYIAKLALTEPNLSVVTTLVSTIYGIAAAAVGTDIYLFGGGNTSGSAFYNQIYKFSTTNNQITTLSVVLPTAKKTLAAAAVGTDIYLFGGQYGASKYSSEIYKFSTTNNQITTLSATLPSKAAQIAAAAVGTDIYLFGGFYYSGSNYQYLNKIYKFSTTNNQITTLSATLPSKAKGIAAAAVGTDIYLFGGYNGNSSNSIYKFSTTNNQITTLSATLPNEGNEIAAAAVGTDIYLFGGREEYSGTTYNQIYKFSTTDNQITTLSATISTASYGIAAAAVGTDIYLFGGSATSDIQKAALDFTYQYKTITAE